MLDQQEWTARAVSAIRSLRLPAINGVCTGGDLALALIADIRVAFTDTTFNAAFIRIGLSTGDWGASRAVDAHDRAGGNQRELIYSADGAHGTGREARHC